MVECGIASRRKAEELIRLGRVRVNSRVASIGDKVDPELDIVEVDNNIVSPVKKEYYMINKPRGFISTRYDPQKRNTVMSLLDRKDYLFPVGRLDKDTRGLILITNDGDLTNRLLHPRFQIERRYIVQVEGRISKEDTSLLLNGITLEDGIARMDRVEVLSVNNEKSVLDISLHEGRKRLIRRMFKALCHPVIDLLRIQFGPISLGDLKEGEIRALTEEEVYSLRCL
ncbi:MAG: pseudouridine synthase [bacterium]